MQKELGKTIDYSNLESKQNLSELDTYHTEYNQTQTEDTKAARSRDLYMHHSDKKVNIMPRKAVRFHNNENQGP